MASIDDIFKHSGVSNKRKLEQPLRNPDEVYKASKLSPNDTNRHASVEDVPMTEGDDEDDFGPELPQKMATTRRILDFVDEADTGSAPDKIDAAWLRKTALNFEKRITKNAELRAKFEDQPQKFIASEADLDSEIKGLSILAEHAELYSDFVKLGCVGSLTGLLAHENTDIAIDAIEIIGELTDEDTTAEDAQWNALVDALLDNDLLGLLVSNFSRLNEEDESDRNGVYYSLGVMENLCSRKPTAIRMAEEDRLLEWLLQRIQRKESPVTQNKQYAAEIFAILAQSAPENRRKLASLDAVDVMLQLVAPYRRRDPDKGSEEEEYMENLFEALTCLVDEPAGKSKFLEAEGTELCLIMIKESKMAKASALRLLDHAAGGAAGVEVCQKAVEAGGLKATFTLFNKTQDHRLLNHLLAIFATMLRFLPADSAERIRLLAKFVEKDYEKITKLIKLRRDYAGRVVMAEEEFKRSGGTGDTEENEVELLSRRLDAGLFTLQLVDVILAWLVAEDGGAKQKVKKLLAERDEDLGSVKATLKEQLNGLDTTEKDSKDLGDMLGTLLDFLQ
ncbi:Beta-catenin-like-like protein [Cladobotryum mycophilum]|uniref:Beta-catenin-like-like protein n=1 Tax=Cladobotryum mycophilum TaxID=491253 RepID=A0ABR0SSK5_9HYPO